MARLRAAGLVAPIVFASSNVSDYADGAGSAMRSDLAQDFAIVNLTYAPNLAAAKFSLGL